MAKVKSLFRGWRKSTTDLSEWNKNDEKLLRAVKNADVAKVHSVLNKKTLVLSKLGPKGLSVFHTACSHGQMQIVEQLLGHGAEVNGLTIRGNSAVHLAARHGWPLVVQRLIQAGAVLDHKDGDGLTSLHQACVECQVVCVQMLLQASACVNAQENTQKTPLFFACLKGDLPVCMELLLKGADVSLPDQHQISPLMAAANQGHKEVCELLLNKGANSKEVDVKGHDALWYAMQTGELQEVFEKAPTGVLWDSHGASDMATWNHCNIIVKKNDTRDGMREAWLVSKDFLSDLQSYRGISAYTLRDYLTRSFTRKEGFDCNLTGSDRYICAWSPDSIHKAVDLMIQLAHQSWGFRKSTSESNEYKYEYEYEYILKKLYSSTTSTIKTANVDVANLGRNVSPHKPSQPGVPGKDMAKWTTDNIIKEKSHRYVLLSPPDASPTVALVRFMEFPI